MNKKLCSGAAVLAVSLFAASTAAAPSLTRHGQQTALIRSDAAASAADSSATAASGNATPGNEDWG